ncbi:MAG: selenocysteine-specific translation elongation factor [Acidimicrobiia bacterium]
MRVVATAGHVDHGKSALVLALTGTDPDRFPEEKARGLTIDLGFAFCTLPSGTDVGFVDVPGHVRFIKNMLAGVGAVDVAVLAVAANEGWMPQTEEHLRILDLLDIRHGVVVVTKSDLVDADALALTELEVEARLAGTTFADRELVACSARTGAGLDEVRAALDRALAAAPAAVDRDRPRLWIDRVFPVKGAGTVVTGTLTGGRIAVGDELVVGTTAVRVRGLEQHGTAADHARPGERVALNLVGVAHDGLGRGGALVRPGQWQSTEVVDVTLSELPDATVPRRGLLTAAIGSGDHRVWCQRLEGPFARLRLPIPLPLAPGDRIVLRDTGSGRTIAGAEVLDVAPTPRAGDAPPRLALPLGARILAGGWIETATLPARTGLEPAAALDAVRAAGGEPVGRWTVDRDRADRMRGAITEVVTEHHRSAPTDPGVAVAAVGRRLGLEPEQVEQLVTGVATLTVAEGRVRHVDHRSDADASPEARALVAEQGREPFAPPPPADVALARTLVRAGALVEIDGLYFTAAAVAEARARVVDALAARGSLTVAEARDVLGSTRKYVVPIMGYLDATGVTRRRGDVRIPGPRSGLSGS